MVRKIVFSLALLCAMGTVQAQNLQLHFDPRNSLYGDDAAPINYLTATFEMFKPDQWGSTFAFVDFDFNFNKRNPGLAYAEIARAIKLGDFPLLAHVEYNGGLGLERGTDFSFSIPSSYLGGVAYPFQLGNFFMNTYVAYKLNALELGMARTDVTWNAPWPMVRSRGWVHGPLEEENRSRNETPREKM